MTVTFYFDALIYFKTVIFMLQQPWSLLPQAVPTYVKPVEARTRPSKSPQKTSQKVSQEHVEVSRHGCQQGAAKVRPDDTVSNGPRLQKLYGSPQRRQGAR